MSDKPNKVVDIKSKIPQPNGPPLQDVPPTKTVVIGPEAGDAPTNYKTAGLVRLTRGNIDQLAGLNPVLNHLDVQLSHFGQKQMVHLVQLQFNRGTKHWPAQIVQQVPEIQAKVKLLEAILEVKRDPKLQAKLKQWLMNDLQGQTAMKRVREAAQAK